MVPHTSAFHTATVYRMLGLGDTWPHVWIQVTKELGFGDYAIHIFIHERHSCRARIFMSECISLQQDSVMSPRDTKSSRGSGTHLHDLSSPMFNSSTFYIDSQPAPIYNMSCLLYQSRFVGWACSTQNNFPA